MRLTLASILIGLLFALFVYASETAETTQLPPEDQRPVPPDYQYIPKEFETAVKSSGKKYQFETEVNRLMKLIINSLYKTKEIFLRELISNASDALDKIRFMSLTKPEVLESNPDLKITIVLDPVKNAIVLTDTGIGMTSQELIKNLGTIAKSGTSEFLTAVENKTADMGLIGQFGVGFYSVFLVADNVTVISKHNNDKQHIWESDSENNFSVIEDPRGNTLGRGTQIIINLKKDAFEYLEEKKIRALVKKYSEYINFPIYLWGSKKVTEEVPDEEAEKKEAEKKEDGEKKEDSAVEDVDEKKEKPKKTKKIEKTVYDWERLNANRPLWMRHPKEVEETEYADFYKSYSKDTMDPLMNIHFRAEGEVEFRALIFIPKVMPNGLLEKPPSTKRLKLFVRRVFITDELPDFLPRYLTFIIGLADSDDMPLNVSRETLQQHAMLKLIKKKIIGKILEHLKKMADNEPERYYEFVKEYNPALKFGVLEDRINSKRLTKLVRFHTSHSANLTSLDEYIKRMKIGQPQIYYITGTSLAEVKASPFVEKLISRGYEVLFLTDPVDEYVVQTVPEYNGKKLQSAAKAGLKFGDEDKDEETKEKELKEKFQPLADWISKTLGSTVSKVEISNRLVKSPCAIVATEYGASGMMEKLIQAQNSPEAMKMFNLNQPKIFEINPSHPIMEGMLKKVENPDEKLEETLKVLYDSALLRGGYMLKDPVTFALNIEKIVRTNLDVDLQLQAMVDIKPAPAVAPDEDYEKVETEEKNEEEVKSEHEEL